MIRANDCKMSATIKHYAVFFLEDIIIFRFFM